MIGGDEKRLMRQTAEDLVVRARVGDQNAIATIELITDNAKRGYERALIAYRMIKQALEKVPVLIAGSLPIPKRRQPRVEYAFSNAVFAGEPDEWFSNHSSASHYGNTIISLTPTVGELGIILLANGPPLFKTGRASAIAKSFKTPEEKHAFCIARRNAGYRQSAIGYQLSAIGQRNQNFLPIADSRQPIALAESRQPIALAESRQPIAIAMLVGDAFGLAQKLQELRKPGARMGDWDPRLAWEFGE